MMSLVCCVLLQIITANGGYVDITLQRDNFTGVISLTTDAYTGFFATLIETELPACHFGYVFGENAVNMTSTTCLSLNITDYGETFGCGEINATNFECKRMGKMSLCEKNKSWTVFYNPDSSCNIQCAGICLNNSSETISVLYQVNFTRVPETNCPRPREATTSTFSTAASTLSEKLTSATVASVTSHFTTRSTQPISGNRTIRLNDETNKNIKDFIPLIAGLCTGGGVLIIVIVVVIVVCVKRRTKKNGKSIHRTTETDPHVGDRHAVYDISNEKLRDSSIHNGREMSKLSGIYFDDMDDFKAVGNDNAHTNHNTILINESSHLKTDQLDQVDSDLNNKLNPTVSFIATDNDTGYLEVRLPKLDNKPNNKFSTTSHSDSNQIDSGYELVGGTNKPISNIYARLGDSIREFENPYNETFDKDNNLRETESGHVNVNIETIPRHFKPDNLEISSGPDYDNVVEGPGDVNAQVIKTKKPDVAISYV